MSGAHVNSSASEHRRRSLVPTLVLINISAAVVSSLGGPLVPGIAEKYHVSVSTAQWSLTIALVVAAVSTPLVGRLADGPHCTWIIWSCLAFITVGCMLAALATSFTALLVGRGLQGIGFALAPATLATARRELAPHSFRRAAAILIVAALSAAGLGYTVSGLLATYVGLSGAFAFGALLQGATLVVAIRMLPRRGGPAQSGFDIPGAIFLGCGVVALMYAISESHRYGIISPKTIGVLSAAAVLLGLWVRSSLRSDDPIADLRLLRNRAIVFAYAASFVPNAVAYFLVSIINSYVQAPESAHGLGYSALVAGLLLVPSSLAGFASSIVGPSLIGRLGAVRLAQLSALALSVAVICVIVSLEYPLLLIVAQLIAGGASGLMIIGAQTLIAESVPVADVGSSIGLASLVRNVGSACGAAVTAAILGAYTGVGATYPTTAGYAAAALVALALCLLIALHAVIAQRRPETTSPRR